MRARRGARGSVRVFGVTAEDIARAGMEVPASARALGHADHREMARCSAMPTSSLEATRTAAPLHSLQLPFPPLSSLQSNSKAYSFMTRRSA